MMSSDKRVLVFTPTLGCDPELFLKRGNDVVGSERIMDEKGLGYSNGGCTVVPDGVQIELHPQSSTCRQSLGSYIAASVYLLNTKLSEMKDLKLSFDAVVKISPEELAALSDKSKVFGCAPSFNAYKSKGDEIKVDAATYTKRHAGGHLHFGFYNPTKELLKTLPPYLDAILGNTCVLLDRDPEAAERRLHYGRAGEYRTPPHGFEYRTLSNFWMRSYQLMSFVFGVGRQGLGAWYDDVHGRAEYVMKNGITHIEYVKADWIDKLRKNVDFELVEKAINTNDLELAYKNWEGVKKFIVDCMPLTGNGLNRDRITNFEFFAKKIQEEGMSYWFPADPFDHWTDFAKGHTNTSYSFGWERFCDQTVEARRIGLMGRLQKKMTA